MWTKYKNILSICVQNMKNNQFTFIKYKINNQFMFTKYKKVLSICL